MGIYKRKICSTVMKWLIRVLQQWLLSHTKNVKNPVLARSAKLMGLKTQRIPEEHLAFAILEEAGSSVDEGSSSSSSSNTSISSSKYPYERVNLTCVLCLVMGPLHPKHTPATVKPSGVLTRARLVLVPCPPTSKTGS